MLQKVLAWVSVVVDARKWVCSVEDPTPAPTESRDNVENNDITMMEHHHHETYKPFARNDSYGVAGWHGPTNKRIFPTLLLEYTRIVRRTILVAMTVGSFWGCVSICTLVMGRERSNEFLSPYLPWYASMLVRSMGFGPIEVEVVRSGSSEEEEKDVSDTVQAHQVSSAPPSSPAVVLVCNHVSYLDMLILCSKFFPSFVAKAPVQKLPIWGRVAQILKCTFVSHGTTKREQAGSAVDEIVAKIQALSSKTDASTTTPFQPILLFPEGTTTNGDYLLPFRKGAFIAGVPVQPILLDYRQFASFNPAWESIGMKTHLRLMLAQPSNHCRMKVFPVMAPLDGNESPQTFADRVRHTMAKEGNLELSDLVYDDKRKYHALLRNMGYQ